MSTSNVHVKITDKTIVKCTISNLTQQGAGVSKYTGIGGPFTESIKTDDIIYFPDETQTGVLDFIKDPTVSDNAGYGKGQHGIIIADGNAMNFSTDFNAAYPSSFEPAAKYFFTALWNGLKFDAIVSKTGASSPSLPNPVLSNFRIEEANRDRVYFDSNQVLTGTTFAGFTLASPSKTVTGMTLTGGGSDNYLTVDSDYAYGENPTMEYDGTDDIVGTGGDLLPFGPVFITNNVVGDVPTIISMSAEDAEPNKFVVTYDMNVTGTGAGFTPRVDAGARNITLVEGSGTSILKYTIDGAAITVGQSLDMAYDSGTGDTIAVAAPNHELVTFGATAVTNNVGILAPVFDAETLLYNSEIIELDFNVGIYGANDGSTPLDFTDLVIKGFAANGGTGTEPSIIAVTKPDSILQNPSGTPLGSALTGGETTIYVWVNTWGVGQGVETFKIGPLDGSSVYNISGNPMLASTETATLTYVYDHLLERVNSAGYWATSNHRHRYTLLAGDEISQSAGRVATEVLIKSGNGPVWGVDGEVYLSSNSEYLVQSAAKLSTLFNSTSNPYTVAIIATADSLGSANPIFAAETATDSQNKMQFQFEPGGTLPDFIKTSVATLPAD